MRNTQKEKGNLTQKLEQEKAVEVTNEGRDAIRRDAEREERSVSFNVDTLGFLDGF